MSLCIAIYWSQQSDSQATAYHDARPLCPAWQNLVLSLAKLDNTNLDCKLCLYGVFFSFQVAFWVPMFKFVSHGSYMPDIQTQLNNDSISPCSPDYIIARCDEAAREREAARGKKPRTFLVWLDSSYISQGGALSIWELWCFWSPKESKSINLVTEVLHTDINTDVVQSASAIVSSAIVT